MKGILVIILASVLFLYGCNRVPRELKPLCERYKIYYDAPLKAYIFKIRGATGGYIVYRNDNGDYYCKMEINPFSRVWIYYGRSYPTVTGALESMETGVSKHFIYDLDDNLSGIKSKCKSICE